MKQAKMLILALTLGSLVAACSSSETIEDVGGPKYVNMYQEVKPVQLTAEQTVFANDNNGFTLNFFQSLQGRHPGRERLLQEPYRQSAACGRKGAAEYC